MNTNVNYTAIGIAVLAGFIMMFGFAYWLLKPSNEDTLKHYIIYFDESVLGLNIDAPVKYRGINVGKVTRLRINPKNSEQVEVLISIEKTTPIKSTTIAKLTSQGITGLSYINLSLGDNNAPCLEAKEGEEYPVIKTAPSFFERFEQSLDNVSSKLAKTLTKTDELLSPQNQAELSRILRHTANFMEQMEKLASDEAIADLHRTLQSLESSSRKVDATLPKIERFVENSILWENKISASLESIMTSYLGVRSSMAEFKGALQSGEFNIKAISADVVPALTNTLLDLQELMGRLNETLNHYERSPGDILFKYEETKKAPGENQ